MTPRRSLTSRRTSRSSTSRRGKPLPDVLAPRLRALFVGINPGLASARAGHHFANPANGFWRLLHEAGFTPRRFLPEEDGRLLELGLGITNIVSRASAGVSDLSRHELLKGAAALGNRIRRARPRAVVFVGLMVWRPFSECFGLATGSARCGEQPDRFAGARLFVLPNPSGRNAHFSRSEMLALFRRTADAIAPGARDSSQ
jgi:TDG/mug DNA glycosylase family protein